MRHLYTPIITLTLLASLPAAAQAQEQEVGLFSVNLGLSIWTIVVFLLLLWVLGRFAWTPILGSLDARERRIRKSIEEANQFRTEARELLEQHRAQIAEARRESQEILAQARSAGDRLRREIEDKARKEGDRILERARREISLERDRALEDIRRESTELALAAAGKLLQKKIDAEQDRVLVMEILDELRPRPVEV